MRWPELDSVLLRIQHLANWMVLMDWMLPRIQHWMDQFELDGLLVGRQHLMNWPALDWMLLKRQHWRWREQHLKMSRL